MILNTGGKGNTAFAEGRGGQSSWCYSKGWEGHWRLKQGVPLAYHGHMWKMVDMTRSPWHVRRPSQSANCYLSNQRLKSQNICFPWLDLGPSSRMLQRKNILGSQLGPVATCASGRSHKSLFEVPLPCQGQRAK